MMTFLTTEYSRVNSARLSNVLQDNIPSANEDCQATAMLVSESTTAFDNYRRILTKPFQRVMEIAEQDKDADGNSKKLAELIAAENWDAFNSELSTLKSRRWLANHDVRTRMNMLDAVLLQFPELKKKANARPTAETPLPAAALAPELQTLEDYQQLAESLAEIDPAGSYSLLSSKEINQLIADTIGSMSENYLDVFQQAVEKNAAFFRDFSDFMTTLTSFISAKDDQTILDQDKFNAALGKLMDTYKVPGLATTLFPVQTGSSVTGTRDRAACESWAREMGLNPDTCIRDLGGGVYIVHIDVSPLTNISNTTTTGDRSFNAAQWAAWQTGLDMQKDNIQTGMQTLTQKFSNAHSTFDNLVKILSSTIASLLDCDKQFFI